MFQLIFKNATIALKRLIQFQKSVLTALYLRVGPCAGRKQGVCDATFPLLFWALSLLEVRITERKIKKRKTIAQVLSIILAHTPIYHLSDFHSICTI